MIMDQKTLFKKHSVPMAIGYLTTLKPVKSIINQAKT
ncbi:hypothetical protein EVA_09676 [gut metagenome]|uniref:Uncharacterized protein n=1 Tax=gut metagenome TaxID=749906 RepID=J9GJL1_9ZZZZ